MKYPVSKFAQIYCTGKGLEIGASATNPFGVDARNVAPNDQSDFEFYKSHQIKDCGEYAPVDIWAEGDDLPVPDNSQDFVLNSHVIEHLPNPIKALEEWHRVIKPTGCIFITCPWPHSLDRDVGREITTLTHVLEDYKLGKTIHTHEGEKRSHYHVWTLGRFLEMVTFALPHKLYVVDVQDPEEKVKNGFSVVLRKRPGS
jgi:SAM-dependent methyltransferase